MTTNKDNGWGEIVNKDPVAAPIDWGDGLPVGEGDMFVPAQAKASGVVDAAPSAVADALRDLGVVSEEERWHTIQEQEAAKNMNLHATDEAAIKAAIKSASPETKGAAKQKLQDKYTPQAVAVAQAPQQTYQAPAAPMPPVAPPPPPEHAATADLVAKLEGLPTAVKVLGGLAALLLGAAGFMALTGKK
jgi:hypothetical protein